MAYEVSYIRQNFTCSEFHREVKSAIEAMAAMASLRDFFGAGCKVHVRKVARKPDGWSIDAICDRWSKDVP